MASRINYWGLVVAGVGFFLTRFTVTLAIYDDPIRFYLAGVVPLALGLGLAAFGVALAVADIEPAVARTTALWCVVGAGTMLVLVVLTLAGSTGGVGELPALRSRTYLSNFLIGGSVGGTLTGLYAARNRQQRDELRRQTNRLVTLNRLLRHEVLNAVTVIRGWAGADAGDRSEAAAVVDSYAAEIEETIEEVTYLARRTGTGEAAGEPVSLRDALREATARVTDRHPEVTVTVEPVPPEELTVTGSERLPGVFAQLLENAVVHGDSDPEITVATSPTSVAVGVVDDGPGLPESQRALLETGDVEEFDDPTTGFGLNVVRLTVENVGGTIETAVGEGGTTVTVELPRAPDRAGDDGQTTPGERLTGVRPFVPHLLVSLVAALIAGVPYGVVSEWLGGSVAGIGVFYGAASPVVGWLTHEFHSVVFGFAYVGLLSVAFERYRVGLLTYLGVGLGWCLVLWAVAASVVGPVWLQLLGIAVPVPSFSGRLLASHLAWGVSLGLLTALGYRYIPRYSRTA